MSQNPASGSVFIYRLLDPRTNEPRYIGKTVNPQTRQRSHARRTKVGFYRTAWTQNLRAAGLQPILEVIEEVSAENWKERERYWIERYRKDGARLTNLTEGGDGSLGLKHSPEARARMKATRSTPEHRAKMSAALRGRQFSSEHCANLSAALKGQKRDAAFRAKRRAYQTGKKHTAETLAKMRRYAIASNQHRYLHTPEAKARSLAVNAGRRGEKRGPCSPERKEKLRLAALSRSPSACPRGHEYTPENTYHRPTDSRGRPGGRGCRICRSADGVRQNQQIRERNALKRQARQRERATMSICRNAIAAYMLEGQPLFSETRQLYSDNDLHDLIQWSRDLLAEGHTHEPVDGFNLRGFIRWAMREMRNPSPSIPPQ